MPTIRARHTIAMLAALVLWLRPALAAVPDYKLGDVAREDVVTSVPLLVVNPEATEALRKKVADQVPFVVRVTTQSADDAEKDLRDSLAKIRKTFLANLEWALGDRPAVEADLDTPPYKRTLRDLVRECPKDTPLDQLAPLWVRNANDEPLIASLVQPIHDVMAQPIVNDKAESPLPPDQPVRLIPVRNLNEAPEPAVLESGGQIMSVGKVISLWRARRLVETDFPPAQQGLGRFAASFLRPNAFPDLALTEVVRARRMEGVTVNDTYETAQVVVRKGQTIDRKAMSALALLREKSLIGTLQTKLEQEQSVAGQLTVQTKWIATGLGATCAALLLILWRVRSRPSGALLALPAEPALAGPPPTALPDSVGEDAWRQRAMVAEYKAARAHEAIRAGALGWMREKLFLALSSQRAELLSVQQRAEAEMRQLEQRLIQLHTPLQERIRAYEKRIAELESELAAKGEENRELIGARISVAKQQLNVERERGRFGSN